MFLNNEEYKHVLDLLDGKIEPSPLLMELAEWIKLEFNVEIYDYICDHTNNGLTRLRIVVWDYHIRNFMKNGVNFDPKIQKKIQAKFASLARKYEVHPEYQDENAIFVACETVKDQITSEALWNSRMQIFELKQGDIWKIEIIFESVHIFYETDEQIKLHEEDGTSEALRRKILDILRKQDKYNVFADGVSCIFTSHQTLNEKYKGSMFYYTR